MSENPPPAPPGPPTDSTSPPTDNGSNIGDNINLDGLFGFYNSAAAVRRYTIASVALMAIAALAGIGLTFLILTGVHRRADPARLGTKSIKSGIVFLTLSIIMALTTQSILLYAIENGPVSSAGQLARASAHTELLWELFDFFAQASIFVTLASIAVGARAVARGGTPGFVKIFRWATFFVAFLVVALGLATYGMRIAVFEGDDVWDMSLFRRADQTATSASILNWIMSLAVSGLAVLSMGRGTGKGVPFLLIIANFLNIIGTTWNMAYYIRWHLHNNEFVSYISILHAILQMWTSLGVLAICFIIFHRKAGGIWTVGSYGDRTKEPAGGLDGPYHGTRQPGGHHHTGRHHHGPGRDYY